MSRSRLSLTDVIIEALTPRLHTKAKKQSTTNAAPIDSADSSKVEDHAITREKKEDNENTDGDGRNSKEEESREGKNDGNKKKSRKGSKAKVGALQIHPAN